MMSILANTAAANAFPDPRLSWAPVAVLLMVAIGFAITNIVASIIVGPRRDGAAKATTYESGMMPIGDTRKRFNVRFYIVAMCFLVIDVEIVFFYPWATVFAPYINSTDPAHEGFGGLLLVRMAIFVGLLLLGYIYALGKGAFRWD